DEVPALVVGGTDGTLGFASGGVGGTAVGLVGATLGSVPAGGGATLGDVVSLAVGAVTGGTLALGSAPGPAEHARTDQTHTATTGATRAERRVTSRMYCSARIPPTVCDLGIA